MASLLPGLWAMPCSGEDVYKRQVVDDLGMREGITAKYWLGTKKYPNGYWADFALTPDGKKLVKLPNGGDAIQWRPDGPNDAKYAVAMTTVVANHLKARNIEGVEDVGEGKTCLLYTSRCV